MLFVGAFASGLALRRETASARINKFRGLGCVVKPFFSSVLVTTFGLGSTRRARALSERCLRRQGLPLLHMPPLPLPVVACND
jgi:hypothetical protein